MKKARAIYWSVICGFGVCICSLGSADTMMKNEMYGEVKKAPTSTQDVSDLVALTRTAAAMDKKTILAKLSQPNTAAYPKLSDSYLALLNDKDSDVRNAAVIACGSMNERRA